VSCTAKEQRDARGMLATMDHSSCATRNGSPRKGLSVAVIEDEGRPLEVGQQRQASNQAVRLEFKRLWSWATAEKPVE